MVTTVPSVAYSGTNPDPVEWANDFVKPAIEELQAGGRWGLRVNADTTVPANWVNGQSDSGSRAFASDYVEINSPSSGGQWYRTVYTAPAPAPVLNTWWAFEYDIWIVGTARDGSAGVSFSNSSGVAGGLLFRIDSKPTNWGWAYEKDANNSLASGSGLTSGFTWDAWNTVRFEFNNNLGTTTIGQAFVNGAQMGSIYSTLSFTFDGGITLIATGGGAGGVTARFRNVKVYEK